MAIFPEFLSLGYSLQPHFLGFFEAETKAKEMKGIHDNRVTNHCENSMTMASVSLGKETRARSWDSCSHPQTMIPLWGWLQET